MAVIISAGIVRKARVVATAWAFVWRVYVKSGKLAGELGGIFHVEAGRGRQSLPLAWDLVNGVGLEAFRLVFVIHAASGALLCFLWSFAMLLSLPQSSRC